MAAGAAVEPGSGASTPARKALQQHFGSSSEVEETAEGNKKRRRHGKKRRGKQPGMTRSPKRIYNTAKNNRGTKRSLGHMAQISQHCRQANGRLKPKPKEIKGQNVAITRGQEPKQPKTRKGLREDSGGQISGSQGGRGAARQGPYEEQSHQPAEQNGLNATAATVGADPESSV